MYMDTVGLPASISLFMKWFGQVHNGYCNFGVGIGDALEELNLTPSRPVGFV